MIKDTENIKIHVSISVSSTLCILLLNVCGYIFYLIKRFNLYLTHSHI